MIEISRIFGLTPYAHEFADFPFMEIINIIDKFDIAQSRILEIQSWLEDNIQNSQSWIFGETNVHDEAGYNFHLYFKHPEDVMAFKLRWL